MISPDGDCYNRLMSDDRKIIRSSESNILRKAEELFNKCEDNLVSVADFCTADGGNSVYILNRIIDIAQNLSNREVQIVLEDQKDNDFNAVFNIISAGGIEKERAGLQRKNVYITVSATDMYDQCLPTGSLHIVLCAFGLHWLSKNALKVKHGLFFHDGDDDEKRTLSLQAALDWEMFLFHRGKELKPGGFMYLFVLTKAEDGSYGTRPFHNLLSRIHDELYTENIITQTEYEDMAVKFYFRTEKEIKLPFKAGSKLSTIGLQLDALSQRHWKALQFPENGSEKDINEWASAVTNVTKLYSYAMLKSSLFRRETEDIASIVNEFYTRFCKNVIALKTDLQYTVTDIIITKRSI